MDVGGTAVSPRLRAVALTLLVASVTCTVVLYAGVVWAAEAGDIPPAASWGAGAGLGGIGGGVGMYLWMHGRMKAIEERSKTTDATLAAMSSQVPALTSQLSALAKTLTDAIDDFKAYTSAARQDDVERRAKHHKLADTVTAHGYEMVRIRERFNALRGVVVDIKGDERGVPKEMTDEPTGPVDVDTGRHRSLGRRG